MQILRKNVRVEQITCEGDLAEIQAQLNRFVERPTEAGISVVLELFPIVVKSNQRGKFKVVAGHRTFLLARSRLISDEKIPVSELMGKGDAAELELFGPACELFGALFFTQSAESLATRLEPFKNDRSLALVARDLSAPKHFDEIFKESGQKRRTRRSKAKEEVQDGSDGSSTAEALGTGQDSQTTGKAPDAVEPVASGVADASAAPEQSNPIEASAAPVDNVPGPDASGSRATAVPTLLAGDETTIPTAAAPNTQVESQGGSDGSQRTAESLGTGQDSQTTGKAPDAVEPDASGVADASTEPKQLNAIEAGAAPADNVASDTSESRAAATQIGLAGDEVTNPATNPVPNTQLDPAVGLTAETIQANPPAIIRRRRRHPKSDPLKGED